MGIFWSYRFYKLQISFTEEYFVLFGAGNTLLDCVLKDLCVGIVIVVARYREMNLTWVYSKWIWTFMMH